MNKTGSDFSRVRVRKYKVMCVEVKPAYRQLWVKKGLTFQSNEERLSKLGIMS